MNGTDDNKVDKKPQLVWRMCLDELWFFVNLVVISSIHRLASVSIDNL